MAKRNEQNLPQSSEVLQKSIAMTSKNQAEVIDMAPQRLLIHSYKTKLGLPRVEFFDCDGKICLIQDSLLGAEPAIRLGSTTGCAQLSQEMAATLIPLLQRFVGTGSIGDG